MLQLLGFSNCICYPLNVAITKFLWMCFSINYSSALALQPCVGQLLFASHSYCYWEVFHQLEWFPLTVAKASNHERRSKSNEPITMESNSVQPEFVLTFNWKLPSQWGTLQTKLKFDTNLCIPWLEKIVHLKPSFCGNKSVLHKVLSSRYLLRRKRIHC